MELTFAQENLISDLAVDEKTLERLERERGEREADLAAYLCERPKEERAMILARIKESVELSN